MPDLDVDQLAGQYRSGATIDQLAQATGVSFATMRTALLAAGVRMRSRGRRPHRPQANPQETSR